MAASSSSFERKYDVFLSFRAEDTGDGFVGYLFEALRTDGIHTYMDKQTLERGHEISPTLMKAIQKSKIYVIVLSKNFASSTRCLDELVQIFECKRNGNGKIVIPIFYDIDPSIVRKQLGSYAVAFGEHEQQFRDKMEKVQQWRGALEQVANLSGYDSKNFRVECKLVQTIAEDVLSKLPEYQLTTNWRPRREHFKPVALSRSSKQSMLANEHFKPVALSRSSKQSMLAYEHIKPIVFEMRLSLDTLFLNCDEKIHNLLLKVIEGYTKILNLLETRNAVLNLHDGETYLVHKSHVMFENWRDEEKNRNKLLNWLDEETRLKHKILGMLLKDRNLLCTDTSSVGSRSIQDRFRGKKFFISLINFARRSRMRDLFEGYQFLNGSRIIITSRDMQLLRTMAHEIYELKGLDQSVAHYAKGNPLAIKVLGSSFKSKSIEECESALEKLKTDMDPDVQKVLRISFDGLGDKCIHDIFLDIACFFTGGMVREDVESILNCNEHSDATNEIGVLIDKSLRIYSQEHSLRAGSRMHYLPGTIPPDLGMHGLLQEMGQRIVSDENKDLGNRRRLWDTRDVYRVLEKNTGTSTIEDILMNLEDLKKDVDRASSNQPNGRKHNGDSLPHNNSKRIKLMG